MKVIHSKITCVPRPTCAKDMKKLHKSVCGITVDAHPKQSTSQFLTQLHSWGEKK